MLFIFNFSSSNAWSSIHAGSFPSTFTASLYSSKNPFMRAEDAVVIRFCVSFVIICTLPINGLTDLLERIFLCSVCITFDFELSTGSEVPASDSPSPSVSVSSSAFLSSCPVANRPKSVSEAYLAASVLQTHSSYPDIPLPRWQHLPRASWDRPCR